MDKNVYNIERKITMDNKHNKCFLTIVNDNEGTIIAYFKNNVATMASDTYFNGSVISTYGFDSEKQRDEFIALMYTTIAEQWEPLEVLA